MCSSPLLPWKHGPRERPPLQKSEVCAAEWTWGPGLTVGATVPLSAGVQPGSQQATGLPRERSARAQAPQTRSPALLAFPTPSTLSSSPQTSLQ